MSVYIPIAWELLESGKRDKLLLKLERHFFGKGVEAQRKTTAAREQFGADLPGYFSWMVNQYQEWEAKKQRDDYIKWQTETSQDKI